MRYIIEFTIEGGIEFFDQVRGFEFDGTAEEFLTGFNELLETVKIRDDQRSFIYCGMKFETEWFVTFHNKKTYISLPNIFTVDEWFEREKDFHLDI